MTLSDEEREALGEASLHTYDANCWTTCEDSVHAVVERIVRAHEAKALREVYTEITSHTAPDVFDRATFYACWALDRAYRIEDDDA